MTTYIYPQLKIFIHDLLANELDTEKGLQKVSFMKNFTTVGCSLGKFKKDLLENDTPEDLESYQKEIIQQFRCCLRTITILYAEKEQPNNLLSYFTQDDIEHMFWASCLLGFDFCIELFHGVIKDLMFGEFKNKPIEQVMVKIQQRKVEKLDPILFTGLCLTKEGEINRKEESKKRDLLWHRLLEAV